MNIFEYIIYFLLFICNKYIDIKLTDKLLNQFENKMINKYLSKTEIKSSDIPVIKSGELTHNNFIKLSNNFRKPVIIKGYLKDTRDVNKWDIDYLKKIIGDFKINVLCKEDKLEIKNYKFSEFANDMKHKNIYINNNHTILSEFPSLYDDIKTKFNNFKDTINTNLRNIHIANLFIGYNRKEDITGSNMHCGGSGNFFCMIRGKKRWTLIDPKYSCILKGRVAQTGIHAQTLFDMPDTDLLTYPKIFNYLPRYDIVLDPGDILWNAPWWWHRIENDDGLNIGMAIRNNKVTKLNLLNNFTYTLSGYTYLLYNTYVINMYEKFKLKKNENFNKKDEYDKTNVLYQIEKLIKKYPKTILIDDIININPKDK